MQTPFHTLLALTVLSKRGEPVRNWSAFAGSVLPDTFIYIAWVWLTTNGVSQSRIWDEIYFEESMQLWSAVFNSVPVYIVLLLLSLLLLRLKMKKQGNMLIFFAVAALIHLATNFPVHVSDAHRHFWPLSDWRFQAPVSYWETKHHGNIVGLISAVSSIIFAIILWWRFPAKWIRIVLTLVLVCTLIIFIFRLFFITGILSVPD